MHGGKFRENENDFFCGKKNKGMKINKKMKMKIFEMFLKM